MGLIGLNATAQTIHKLTLLLMVYLNKSSKTLLNERHLFIKDTYSYPTVIYYCVSNFGIKGTSKERALH